MSQVQVKCLTCKHAPDWPLPIGNGDAIRCCAPCRKVVDITAIPATYIIQERWCEVFSDGSGFPTQCKAFENKC